MSFKNYEEGYRKNLDTLCTMFGFVDNGLFDFAKDFIPQNLKIIGPPDSQKQQVNCHGYTFGKDAWLKVKKVHDAISDGILVESEKPQKGNIIIYYIEGSNLPIIKHSGIYLGEGKVKSKWANGPIFIHDVFNVPYSYGEKVKFFYKVNEDLVL